jgi:hypothetical protein
MNLCPLARRARPLNAAPQDPKALATTCEEARETGTERACPLDSEDATPWKRRVFHGSDQMRDAGGAPAVGCRSGFSAPRVLTGTATTRASSAANTAPTHWTLSRGGRAVPRARGAGQVRPRPSRTGTSQAEAERAAIDELAYEATKPRLPEAPWERHGAVLLPAYLFKWAGATGVFSATGAFTAANGGSGQYSGDVCTP